MAKKITLSAEVETTPLSVTVTAAPGSAGSAVAYSSASSSVTLTNVSGACDMQYKVDNGAWVEIERYQGVVLPINLAASTLYLRRVTLDGGLCNADLVIDGVPVLAAGAMKLAQLAQDSNNNTLGIVGADGAVLQQNRNTLGLSSTIEVGTIYFDQNQSGNKFLCTDNNVSGSYVTQVFIATGDILAPAITPIPATNIATLKTTAGTACVNGNILGAKWLTDTRFMFTSRSLNGAMSNKSFLYICNYNGTAWTVGNNSPAFDNNQASFDFGLFSGGQADNVSLLHARSWDSNVSGSVILVGEYNTASGRVNGSTNDAVRVYRSTDSGATFSPLINFNTDGSTNQIRHCHGVKFDVFTGDWYMFFGDDPTSALLRWDGVSAAPPANTAMPNFSNYRGWEVLSDNFGFECRSGDVTIHPNNVYYMSDNSEPNTPIKYAFQVSKNKPMYKIQSAEFERTNGRPPLIACNLPNGAAIWASMSESTDTFESWKGFDFWYTTDGSSYIKIAKTRATSVGASFSVLYNMFITKTGFFVISGIPSKGAKLLSGANNGSLLTKVSKWNGIVNTLQGNP
jgi:hypothetical protein